MMEVDAAEIARIELQRPTTARHEAAHAVAALHYDCPIENVSIVGKWPSLGTTRMGVSKAADIVVIICGPLAERAWEAFYPGARLPLQELLGTDAEAFNYLRDGLDIKDDELLDLKSEAVEFLSDTTVQTQIDRVAQSLLDMNTLTTEQVRTILQFTASRAPYKQQPNE